MENKIIIGIDPGLERTGFSIIRINKNKTELEDYGLIETNRKMPLERRLSSIYRELEKVIDRHRPQEAAIEKIFFSKKAQTQLDTTYARGVILLLLDFKNIKIYEYNPRSVKSMITGNGNCDKNQMMKTIQLIFSLKEKIQPDDISDSIAIAITHYRTSKFEAIRKEALNDIFNKR